MKLSRGLNTSGRMYVLRIKYVSHKKRENMLKFVLQLTHNKTLLRNVITVDVIGEDDVILENIEPFYCDLCHYRDIIKCQQILREIKHSLTICLLTMKADVEGYEMQAQL